MGELIFRCDSYLKNSKETFDQEYVRTYQLTRNREQLEIFQERPIRDLCENIGSTTKSQQDRFNQNITQLDEKRRGKKKIYFQLNIKNNDSCQL